MSFVFTNSAADVFNPVDGFGAARQVENDEAQTWGTEVEAALNLLSGLNAVLTDITTSLSLSTSHRGSTLSVSVAGVTVTVTAATDYNARHVSYIVNPMTDAAVRVISSASDFTDFFIYPGQMATIYRNGSDMYAVKPPRWRPGAVVNVYVNSSTGVDTNDGLVDGRPVLTLNKAAQIVYHNIDHGGNLPHIKATGTFTEGLSLTAYGQLSGASTLYIEGYNSTKFTWVPSGGYCFQAGDNSIAILSYIYFHGPSSSGAVAVLGHQHGIIDFSTGIEWGAFPSGYHILWDTSGKINFLAGQTISGNCTYHLFCGGGVDVAYQGLLTHTISGSPTCDTFIRLVMSGNNVSFGAGNTWSGSFASGTDKYSVVFPSAINLSGVTLPGSDAGSASNGGEVA